MEQTKAFVCKTLDYKDSSKILYVYTKNGNKSIIARGVKKMNSVNRFLSQVGNLISFSKTRGELPTLKDGELVKDYEMAKQDLESYTYMAHILELVNGTISDDNDHNKMFSFLERLFGLFDQGEDPEILTFIFELKLLYFLGYGINFKGCQICDDNVDLVYSISDGGLICRKHLEAFTDSYDSDVYNKIKELYRIDIDQYENKQLSKNERIMFRHIIDTTYDEFISFKTKSRAILKQIKKY